MAGPHCFDCAIRLLTTAIARATGRLVFLQIFLAHPGLLHFAPLKRFVEQIVMGWSYGKLTP